MKGISCVQTNKQRLCSLLETSFLGKVSQLFLNSLLPEYCVPSIVLSSSIPLSRAAASDYLKKAGETHGTVEIHISIGKLPAYL